LCWEVDLSADPITGLSYRFWVATSIETSEP
jgi:hypothetical protein